MLYDLIEFFKDLKVSSSSKIDSVDSNSSIIPKNTQIRNTRKNEGSPRILSTRKLHNNKNFDRDFALRNNSEYSEIVTDSVSDLNREFDLQDSIDNEKLIPSPITMTLKKVSNNINDDEDLELCVGIKEFSSEEGLIGIPRWIIDHLELADDGNVNLKWIKLKKGNFAQLLLVFPEKMPPSVNPKVILESHLRKNVTALVENQPITVKNGQDTFIFRVLELKPNKKVDVVDTDLTVDITFLNTEPGSNSHIPNLNSHQEASSETPFELTLGNKITGSLLDHSKFFLFRVGNSKKSKINYKALVEISDSDIGK
ncbi:Ubiquitin fusion degradation protein 1-like protein [Smittium mucronatum]|uniref:Ubiquitin fusion degradation protein 1-like protein n=1 Tax=Smittium mucronatum TaxID=133383 RepID=A0A1R0H721_9FUNG|nr:Ubiquitin fusion degradation protein 1-like protein [Smittium mucronatum]